MTAVVLFGAGCGAAPKTESVPSAPEPVAANTPAETTPTTPATTPNEELVVAGETRALTAADVTDTWETYTSKSLGFSFDWPTKGRYAPEWEVKHYQSDSSDISNGCVKGRSFDLSQISRASVGTTVFCVNRQVVGVDAHCSAFSDTYATPFGKTIIAIEFDREICIEQVPAPMTLAEYEKNYWTTLDSIVGTFKLNQ